MGLKLFSSSFFDEQPPKVVPNPDPSNFTIVRAIQQGRFLLLEAVFHDCTNYEGRKIMLYQDVDLVRLLNDNGNVLDPHFAQNVTKHSPIARFQPTELGWARAKAAITAFLEQDDE